jgi:SAM-dependent methyltransferase
MNKRLREVALDVAWFPAALYLYWRNLRRQGDACRERDVLFRDFVRSPAHEHCLQIGVHGTKYGSNWVSVDLFDESPEIDFHYDVADLKFDDETFDRVVCNAILEHVSDPAGSIRELHRVMKPGAQIWVEVPFHHPYHPDPRDYWRVTLEGLESWMGDFRKLRSGVFTIHHCFFWTGVFYWGEKPARGA